jgi:zinc transporter
VRSRLAALRRRVIALRRYIAPQRDAMSRLSTERIPWLSESDRARLREVAERVTRYVEDLGAARERAAIIQEELTGRMTAQMNRTMYVLSLVAAIQVLVFRWKRWFEPSWTLARYFEKVFNSPAES